MKKILLILFLLCVIISFPSELEFITGSSMPVAEFNYISANTNHSFDKIVFSVPNGIGRLTLNASDDANDLNIFGYKGEVIAPQFLSPDNNPDLQNDYLFFCVNGSDSSENALYRYELAASTSFVKYPAAAGQSFHAHFSHTYPDTYTIMKTFIIDNNGSLIELSNDQNSFYYIGSTSLGALETSDKEFRMAQHPTSPHIFYLVEVGGTKIYRIETSLYSNPPIAVTPVEGGSQVSDIAFFYNSTLAKYILAVLLKNTKHIQYYICDPAMTITYSSLFDYNLVITNEYITDMISSAGSELVCTVPNNDQVIVYNPNTSMIDQTLSVEEPKRSFIIGTRLFVTRKNANFDMYKLPDYTRYDPFSAWADMNNKIDYRKVGDYHLFFNQYGYFFVKSGIYDEDEILDSFMSYTSPFSTVYTDNLSGKVSVAVRAGMNNFAILNDGGLSSVWLANPTGKANFNYRDTIDQEPLRTRKHPIQYVNNNIYIPKPGGYRVYYGDSFVWHDSIELSASSEYPISFFFDPVKDVFLGGIEGNLFIFDKFHSILKNELVGVKKYDDHENGRIAINSSKSIMALMNNDLEIGAIEIDDFSNPTTPYVRQTTSHTYNNSYAGFLFIDDVLVHCDPHQNELLLSRFDKQYNISGTIVLNFPVYTINPFYKMDDSHILFNSYPGQYEIYKLTIRSDTPKDEVDFLVFPNPTDNSVSMNEPFPAGTEVRLMTAEGGLICKWDLQTEETLYFQFSSLRNYRGLYNGRYILYVKFPSGKTAVKTIYYFGNKR